MCKINIDMKEPAEIFVNGVNAGRMEILKQLQDILKNDDSLLNQLNDIDILVKRYEKDGVM